MSKEIAAYVDGQGYTTTLNQAGKLVVYEMIGSRWQEQKSGYFVLKNVTGIKELRAQMAEIIAFLGECKIFAARSVAGVPYFELEKASVSVWEMPGKVDEFLDDLWQRANEPPVPDRPENKQPAPELIETFPGCFQISLLEVQRSDSLLSSKQVLLPILRQGNFHSLQVLCSHLPPWLELELENRKYQSFVDRQKGETKVLIKLNTAHE